MKRSVVLFVFLHIVLSSAVLGGGEIVTSRYTNSEILFPTCQRSVIGGGIFYQNASDLDKAFDQISDGLSKGEISEFTNLLPSQCYLSLSNGISGYYSYNQTYYILQDFFKVKRPISFKYTSIASNKNPYATGILTYEFRNKKETAQVFISVESKGTGWQISQITIK